MRRDHLGATQPGYGAGFNTNDHEPVLLASRGGIGWPKEERPGGVHFWRQLYANGGKVHSAKPEAFLDWVESVSPAPRLEMFARRVRLAGWDYWGDQSHGTAEMIA